MTRQHFEFAADWVARNDSEDAYALAVALFERFGERFDRAKFDARVAALRTAYGLHAR